MSDITYFNKNEYDRWKEIAYHVGWIHVHDNLLVCDLDDVCVGEWDDNADKQSGWIYTEFVF